MNTSQERFTALVQAWTADLYRFAYWLARDWPRPPDDPHAGQLASADPLFAVWGRA